jgi:secretion/DNA translocation related CpaE-like protein
MLREALPRIDDLSVLSWDRGRPTQLPPEAAAAVATGAVRGYDLVVADLPRALDPATSAWLRLVDIVLLVVPAAIRAVAAAGRVLDRFEPVAPDIRLVVRGPAPPSLPAELVAETIGRPLFAELRPEAGLRSAIERAEAPGLRPRGPLARCAARVLDAVDRLERAA